MSNQNNIEAIKSLIDELNGFAENAAILVEGKKDKQALEQIGVKGDFYLIKQNGRGLIEAAEQIAKKYTMVIFMFDLDPAGRKLLKQMKQIFIKLGIKIEESFMFRLLTLANSQTVEGI